jgi:hypothetical protein
VTSEFLHQVSICQVSRSVQSKDRQTSGGKLGTLDLQKGHLKVAVDDVEVDEVDEVGVEFIWGAEAACGGGDGRVVIGEVLCLAMMRWSF